jgi:hypothetical protein
VSLILGSFASASSIDPTLFCDLMSSAYGERSGGHIPCNAGAGTDIRAVLNRDGGDQGRVAADKHSFANAGDVLVHSVIVAGDNSSADICACSHLSIAQIGEMVGLGAFAEAGFFGFDEVSHVGVLADFAARPQVGEGAYLGTVSDRAVGEDAALAK